jgi:hypothetical protein
VISEIIVVSGIPRSGTSMMMRMLSCGGIPVLDDGLRRPDVHNPWGYYEFDRVKRLAQDKSWLADAGGKAVKVIYALLHELPSEYRYKVIFMDRVLEEVVASQDAMIAALGHEGAYPAPERIISGFRKQLAQVDKLLATRREFSVLRLDYHETVADPAYAVSKIEAFLRIGLDQAAMCAAVDVSLYRQRVHQHAFCDLNHQGAPIHDTSCDT